MKAFTQCFILCAAAVFAFSACSPKTTAPPGTDTEKPKEKPATSDDPCAKFSDSKAGESALDAHVIYRDFIRSKQFKQAIPYWRRAFNAAPAADGKRQTHFEDGVDIYDYLLNQQETDAQKELYLDSIIYMYNRLGKCYGDSGYVDGRIAFDLYYKYRELAEDQTIYNYFANSIDAYGLDAPSFVINPFAALLVEMHDAGELEEADAKIYVKQILAITVKHEDDKEEGWPVVLSYAPSRLEYFETVKGFYDCGYYKAKYFAGRDLDSTDCEELFLINTQLMGGGCSADDPELALLDKILNGRCAVQVTAGPLRRAKDCLESGDYSCAIDAYKEYVASTDDADRKAKYLVRIAKIYYAHLRQFSSARQYAREAMQYRPNWGEPYMLIGKLYASSGPLCGPGRGWESQIVTWPALDMFYRAKQVDPSVSREANKLIDTYEKYMPAIEEIFQRQLKEGDSFFVGCWIQETTTIRAAP